MNIVDYSRAFEAVHTDGRVVPARIGPHYNGAGPIPIALEGALFSASVNQLARLGWKVRNTVFGADR